MTKWLTIERSDLNNTHNLLNHHYRSEKLKVCYRVFIIRNLHPKYTDDNLVGVIVYTMPMPHIRLRNIATSGIFTGFKNRSDQLKILNEHLRTISRVVIDPRYRGLGLASWLVQKTADRVKFPIIESLAVMGNIHPFFEKAGFKPYTQNFPERINYIQQAFKDAGIRFSMLKDPLKVQKHIDKLNKKKAMQFEKAVQKFLQSYRRRAYMPPGIERTRYVLSRLTENPVYYIKFCDKSILKKIKTEKQKIDQLIA